MELFSNPMSVGSLILIMAVADRLLGWGGFGRVKPLIGITLALCLWASLFGFNKLVIITLPVAFAIWRTPGWKTLGGSLDAENMDETIGTFKRHLLAMAFLAPAYFANSLSWLDFWMLVAFAASCASLSNLNHEQGTRYNHYIEAFRGALLGLVVSAVLLT